MNWKLSFQAEKNILIITSDGILSQEDSLKMLEEIVAFNTVQHCPNVLQDFRKISSVNARFLDVYNIPKRFEMAGVPHNVRIALLIPENFKEIFSFYETVNRNRGFQVMTFNDYSKAENWLLGEK